jgi:alanyl-tRNA synthetase
MKERVAALRERMVAAAVEKDGVKVIHHVVPMPIRPEAVKDLAFQIGGALPQNMLCVIGSSFDGKPLLTVMLSKNLIDERGWHAGNFVREAAKLIQGGGGGAPHFATAGGKNVDGLEAAVEKVLELAGL